MPWSTGVLPGGNSEVLHAGADVVLGRFRCLPGDPLWSSDNVVESGDLVVFPGTAVVLSRGRERIVADRNLAVLYADGQSYRRSLLHPAGDHCDFLRLGPDLVANLVDRGRALPANRGWLTVPTGDRTYARLRVLVRALTRGPAGAGLSADEVQEELLHLVDATCSGGAPVARRHAAELADSVRIALSQRSSGAPLSLADTARTVGYSPFHMARVFRAVTGSSVHSYAMRLRLRLAFDRIAGGERDLAALAAELGFASHSHFTLRFRQAFGQAPSILRDVEGRPATGG